MGRDILVACAFAGVFGLCASSVGQTPSVSDLPKSVGCATKVPGVFAGEAAVQTTMRLREDRGWCWFDVTGTNGSLKYVPQYVVARPPAHGEIVMGEINQRARIAYRPTSGFVGNDSFVIVNKMTHSERPVAVTVIR